jgi:hypothetical protein
MVWWEVVSLPKVAKEYGVSHEKMEVELSSSLAYYYHGI